MTDGALVPAGLGSRAAPVAVLAVDLPPWRERTVPWLWLVELTTAQMRRKR